MKVPRAFMFRALLVASAVAHSTASFSALDVEKLLRQSGSVDEVLKKLPQEIRENFFLVYSSRNKLQAASMAEPRIVVSSKDASFLMTVSGSKQAEGGNTVEILQENADGTGYDAYSANYSAARGFWQRTQVTIEKNPASCVTCHGERMRPIWEQYPRWVGIYGSNEDRLHYLFDLAPPGWTGDSQARDSALRQAYLERGRSNPEVLAFKKFKQALEVAGPNNRYASLHGLRDADLGTLEKKNILFEDRLVKAEMRQLVQYMLTDPQFSRYRAALLGFTELIFPYVNSGFMGKVEARKWLGLFPEVVASSQPEQAIAGLENELAHFKTKLQSQIEAFYADQNKRIHQVDPEDVSIHPLRKILLRKETAAYDVSMFWQSNADLLFLAEKMGIPLDSWWQGKTIYRVGGRFSPIYDFRHFLFERISRLNPDLVDEMKNGYLEKLKIPRERWLELLKDSSFLQELKINPAATSPVNFVPRSTFRSWCERMLNLGPKADETHP
jgi:hypothetical protein